MAEERTPVHTPETISTRDDVLTSTVVSGVPNDGSSCSSSDNLKTTAQNQDSTSAVHSLDQAHQTLLDSKLNRIQIPLATFGTFKLQGDECIQAMQCAIQTGYRRFDTAAVYRNEEQVGEAIRSSGIKRSEFYVTTKLHPKAMKSAAKVLEAVKASFDALNIDYIDLLLIHWPAASRIPSGSEKHAGFRMETWRALSEVVNGELSGVSVKSIGVSNFNIRHLESLRETGVFEQSHCSVNQVEFHPLIDNNDLISYCSQHGILVEAYAPLGCGEALLLEHPVVLKTAAKHAASCAQVLLAWAVFKGVVPVCKASSAAHIHSNFSAVQAPIALDDVDIEELGHLGSLDHHFCWNSDRVL